MAGSAWERLPKAARSAHVGWAKNGEFFCPHCTTQIGKNLLDERPFWNATEHLKTHE